MTTKAARLRARLWKDPRNHQCCHCGEALTPESATLEHIVPLSEGGGNKDNVTLACAECNHKRSSRPFGAWWTKMRAEGDSLFYGRSWYEGWDLDDEQPVDPKKPEKKAKPRRQARLFELTPEIVTGTAPLVNPTFFRRGQAHRRVLKEMRERKAKRINFISDRGMPSAFMHAWAGEPFRQKEEQQ